MSLEKRIHRERHTCSLVRQPVLSCTGHVRVHAHVSVQLQAQAAATSCSCLIKIGQAASSRQDTPQAACHSATLMHMQHSNNRLLRPLTVSVSEPSRQTLTALTRLMHVAAPLCRKHDVMWLVGHCSYTPSKASLQPTAEWHASGAAGCGTSARHQPHGSTCCSSCLNRKQQEPPHAQEVLVLGMYCWLSRCLLVAAAQCFTKALRCSGLVYLAPGRPCTVSG